MKRAEQQQIITVHVEVGNLWLHADLLPLLERALARLPLQRTAQVLSPFDPVVWDRKRAEQLFLILATAGVLYPSAETPVWLALFCRYYIVGSGGRMDAKMHRQTGIIEVISLWLQEGD